MPSHLHMICRADGVYNLSEILRDFKKYTSKSIIKEIQVEMKAEVNGCWNISQKPVNI